MKIVVSVDTFGKEARELLEKNFQGEIRYYVRGRNLREEELKEVLKSENPDIVIAGTEKKYDGEKLRLAPNLKMISRVGIGLDSIDLGECNKRNIVIANTTDAPSNATAELTIGQIYNTLRRIQFTDKDIREGEWNRYIGRELSDCSVGIIGYGRIGKIVARKLRESAKEIYINDINPEQIEKADSGLLKTTLDEILRKSDIITLHIPLVYIHQNLDNRDFISKKELSLMKKNAILVNTSRGGIVNESDLYEWLSQNPEASAALDVFEEEPYPSEGKLLTLSNCYLTPHIGSCSTKSRYEMETGAVKNVIKFLEGEKNFNIF